MRYDDFLLTFYIRQNRYGSYLALKAAIEQHLARYSAAGFTLAGDDAKPPY